MRSSPKQPRRGIYSRARKVHRGLAMRVPLRRNLVERRIGRQGVDGLGSEVIVIVCFSVGLVQAHSNRIRQRCTENVSLFEYGSFPVGEEVYEYLIERLRQCVARWVANERFE